MKKKNKLREWMSIQRVNNPDKFILVGIILLNIVFFAVAAFVILQLSPDVEGKGFWKSLFYTITMILDAGCIQFVVADVGQAGVALIIACLGTVMLGMIMFTGAVIGYVTNRISGMIDTANSGGKRLRLSGHTVILNWNTRASEILNDLMYSPFPEKVVVLVSKGKETIEKEIEDRLADTIAREHMALVQCCKDMGFVEKLVYMRKNKLRNRLSIIVRQGDSFSTKQLMDISLNMAKSVIILGKDFSNTLCRYDYKEKLEHNEKGNSNTIKTLVQVAQITGATDSADNQKIVVEVEDEWTLSLVNKIIEHKQREGKCNIVPVSVNKILGQILSQFSIMPELNLVYSELFSNKGAAFYSRPVNQMPESDVLIVGEYNKTHTNAIALTHMLTSSGAHEYFMSEKEGYIDEESAVAPSDFSVKLNSEYRIEKKNVIILGHNSKSAAIMEGFDLFCNEWDTDKENPIIDILIIDDKKSLEKHDYYRNYAYVNTVVEADIFEREIIYKTINDFADSHVEDTSVLILSDDTVLNEELDASALTYLIYVQDIIREKQRTVEGFNTEKIDVIVEILNPKNYDVVHNYSVENVVISNRYISKMVTQISSKESLFDFYNDILTYDDDTVCIESKEFYMKSVNSFFKEIPPRCNAQELVSAVYAASPDDNKEIVLGYVSPGSRMVIFSGNRSKTELELTAEDKLIIFSNH